MNLVGDTRVREGRRAGWRTLAALLCLAALPAAGCNWLTGSRHAEQPKEGIILTVDRHKAALYVNEVPVTLLSAQKPNVIGLEPGTYRVAVKKAGFFTRYFDVTVTRKQFVRLEARLPAELD